MALASYAPKFKPITNNGFNRKCFLEEVPPKGEISQWHIGR
jgi:hypothetical protein